MCGVFLTILPFTTLIENVHVVAFPLSSLVFVTVGSMGAKAFD